VGASLNEYFDNTVAEKKTKLANKMELIEMPFSLYNILSLIIYIVILEVGKKSKFFFQNYAPQINASGICG